ncbi:MAG: UDP-glucose/GDP-mannose dehydrogenase family protein [Chloroflexi bacterium]|nr:MAG: UDP-glucose/GDP-mannose dehydrogenase family protein [Chloroflexota bacterium]
MHQVNGHRLNTVFRKPGAHDRKDRARICVVGAGYVGLVTAVCLAQLGHAVVCIETDRPRLAALRRGRVPFREPGLSELMAETVASGALEFTDKFMDVIPQAQFAFIAVHTPPTPSGSADTSFVFSATRSVLRSASPGLIIIVKSTVPPGTADTMAGMAAASGENVEVISNPEFLREGSACKDFFRPDRIVIGAASAQASRSVAALYKGIDAPVVICGRRSAEFAKYASNALLAARLSLVNELASICECVGADIDEVVEAVALDRRIGGEFLEAGLGWGGSCFPKDLAALIYTAQKHNLLPLVLNSARAANEAQHERTVKRLNAALPQVEDATIGILGLAFKPGTDDIRGSPSIDIIRRLTNEYDFAIRAHDPLAMGGARKVLPDIRYCPNAYEVAAGCDALVLATKWPEYLELDWALVRSQMRGNIVLDGRNALDGSSLRRIGFAYLSFGRCVDGLPFTEAVDAKANTSLIAEMAAS